MSRSNSAQISRSIRKPRSIRLVALVDLEMKKTGGCARKPKASNPERPRGRYGSSRQDNLRTDLRLIWIHWIDDEPGFRNDMNYYR
jgi:hypothetical protein